MAFWKPPAVQKSFDEDVNRKTLLTEIQFMQTVSTIIMTKNTNVSFKR
jgi:hypothetical protein